MHVASEAKEKRLKDDQYTSPLQSQVMDINKKADEILLSKYTPAGVLVNDSFEIIQFRGSTSAWLSPPPGKPTLNLIKMANEGLAFELRNILLLAKTKNAPAKKEGIAVKTDRKQQYVTIEAIPILDAPEPHYMVLFQNTVSYNKYGEANSPEAAEDLGPTLPEDAWVASGGVEFEIEEAATRRLREGAWADVKPRSA